MNKNLFKSLAFAAVAVIAGACAKEQITSGDGETVEMTFNVDVPETTITTKGLSDAAQVDELVFDAFRTQNDTEPIEGLRQVVAVENSRATIQVKLIKGQNYRFVFWAQKANNGYYNTDNLSNITVDYSKALANDSSLDAFFAKEDVTNVQNPISKTIILKRPFAQVNYVTKEELSEGLYIKESQITVKNALTSFNPLRNKLSGEQDVTFQFNAVPTEKLLINGTEYNCLATAFILAKSDNSKDIVDVEAKFKANKGYSVTVSTPGLPCQRNYRTNVIGNFMSVDGTYNVEIDSAFKGDFQSDYVANALSSGQVVTLTEDYSLPEGSGGVAVPSGKTSVLNLNGKKFSNENGYKENKAALQVHGDLTINGDGEVYCEGYADNNAIIVEQGGHLVINGGTYNVGKADSGKSNATIFVLGPDNQGRNGSVEINGGVFMAEAGSDGTPFVLNQHDDITVNCFSVKGGTFVGFNPASVNEAKETITSFVAEGYRAVETTYNGKQAWEVVAIPAVGTQDDFNAALNDVKAGESATICLGSGEFTTYNKAIAQGKTLKFVGKGAETTTFVCGRDLSKTGEYRADYSLENSDVVFSNLKLDVGTADYLGFIRAKSLIFKNCVIDGRLSYMGVGKVVFKDCTFNQTNEDYNLWTYSGNEFVFETCTFNSVGKFLNLFKDGGQIEYKVTIKNCTFNSSMVNKSALELKKNADKTYEVYFEGKNTCTNIRESTLTGSMLYNSNEGETDSVVYVDGKKVWEKGAKVK